MLLKNQSQYIHCALHRWVLAPLSATLTVTDANKLSDFNAWTRQPLL